MQYDLVRIVNPTSNLRKLDTPGSMNSLGLLLAHIRPVVPSHLAHNDKMVSLHRYSRHPDVFALQWIGQMDGPQGFMPRPTVVGPYEVGGALSIVRLET